MKFLKYFEAMEFNSFYGGLVSQYSGKEITLAGGNRVSGGGSVEGKDYNKLRFKVYSNALYNETNDAEKSEIGSVDLYIDDDKSIVGLVNIEIKPQYRKQGYGKIVISEILDTTKNGLYIFDVKKSAIGFWQNMGIEWTSNNLIRNGFIPKR